jgi:hypothetical protein
MARKFIATLAVAAAVVLAPQGSSAQDTEGFTLAYTDLGAVIGLGGIQGASLAFGGRFEKAIKAVPDLGDGIIGIQASVDYYSWGDRIAQYDWDYSYLPIGVTANYHFNLENNKIDPFLGAGLGYFVVNCSYNGPGVDVDCGDYASGVYFIGKAGIRYFLQRLALYADVGAGAATLNVGAMFKIR